MRSAADSFTNSAFFVGRHSVSPKTALLLSLLLFFSMTATAENRYPLISALYSNDIQYAQLSFDISEYYRAKANGTEIPGLVFRRYTPPAGYRLISLASLFSLPYETIASLNRFSSNIEFDGQTEILIPNLPFLFLPEFRSTDLELAVFQGHDWDEDKQVTVTNRNGKQKFFYLDEQSYTDIERSFFLGFFRFFPVPKGRISSNYGIRKDPFHGRDSFHGGVDIAAPAGTDVICPQSGTVTLCAENHPIYGTYIEIQHDGNVKTRYGHLSKVFVKEGAHVFGGDVIAAVGSTGRATGPHLHFEYLNNNQVKNPQLFLKF